MALTNSEMQGMVRAGLGRGEARTDQDTLIVQSLNLGMEEIARRPGVVSWDCLDQDPTDVTLTASQGYIDCDDIITAASLQSYDKVHHLYSLAIIDGASYYPISGISKRKWGKQVPSHADTDREGRPTMYSRIGDRIYLYPVPDQAYEMRVVFSIWPTPIQHTSGVITAGTTAGQASAESVLENLDSLTVIYAVYWAHYILGNAEQSARAFGMFEKQIKDALRSIASKIDNYAAGGGAGSGLAQQTSAPSVDAQAGTATFDAHYSSTPEWG